MSSYFAKIDMYANGTPYYKPLLVPGIHYKTLAEVETLCVTAFGNNEQRRKIFNLFSDLLNKVLSLGLDWVIWINGSFVTEKTEPGDIDVLFVPADQKAVNSLEQDEKRLLMELFSDRGRTKKRYLTDAIFAPEVTVDPNQHMYWRGVFGFDREDRPRGWVQLKLGEQR